MSYTLLQLRQHLARSLNSLVQGTVASGTTATIVDTILLDSGQFADDHFNGGYVYISDTTDDLAPKGESRYVTDFVSSTGTVTVGQAFSVAPGAGDTYDLYPSYSPAELNEALLMTVRDWRLHTSLVLSSSTSEYALTASGLHEVSQIVSVSFRQATDDGDVYGTIDDFRVWDNAGTLTIEFDENIDASLVVRVEYTARYDQLGAGGVFDAAFDDARTVGGDLEMHILRAKQHIYNARMQHVNSADRDWYAALYREVTERIRAEGSEPRRRASRIINRDDFGSEQNERRYQSTDWWL